MKSYFVGRDDVVIIPFKAVLYTIENPDYPSKLKVVFSGGVLNLGEKQRFLKEYTAWLDTQDSPKTLT